MTILSLRFKSRTIKDYSVKKGQQLTIGRNPDNDIVIDSMAVSGYHARVDSEMSSFILHDLDSTNGVYVNENQIKQHILQHNDVIQIGKHELVFDKMIFDRSARPDNIESDGEAFVDETMFLDTKQYKELIEQLNKSKEGGEPDEMTDKSKSSLLSRIKSKFSPKD